MESTGDCLALIMKETRIYCAGGHSKSSSYIISVTPPSSVCEVGDFTFFQLGSSVVGAGDGARTQASQSARVSGTAHPLGTGHLLLPFHTSFHL